MKLRNRTWLELCTRGKNDHLIPMLVMIQVKMAENAHFISSVMMEALKTDALRKICSELEPNLRRIVSEEVDRALGRVGSSRIEERFHLQFRSKISANLFTGGKVEGDQGSKIWVELVESKTGEVVRNGPESGLILDVVVLEGDFSNEDQSWTDEEFMDNLVREREGKRQLLIGDLHVSLVEGVGTLGEIMFTDNSSWTRSRKFRLGLKVSSNYSVRGGKSEAFTVKDQRGELYKKHYPPAPEDEVWRLEKIGKDGSFHRRLNEARIYTVETFLQLAVRDSQKMRHLLGSGMSNKMWEVLIDHAKTCLISEKYYCYSPKNMKDLRVVINGLLGVKGVISCGKFLPVELLAEDNKMMVDELAKMASQDWKSVVEFDYRSLKENQILDGGDHLSNSFREEIDFSGQDMRNVEMQQFQISGNDEFMDYHHDSNWLEDMFQNEEMQYFLPSLWLDQDGYCHSPYGFDHQNSNGYAGDNMADSSAKALLGWLKLKAAMRWGIFVRKQAALRRARLIELE